MARLFAVFMVVMAVAVAPAAAADGVGNGPYAPFPTAANDSRAGQYYAQLGIDPDPQRIEAGDFVGGLRAGSTAGSASRRAGVDQGHVGLVALLVAVALAGVAAAGVVLARRRGPPEPAPA